MPLVSAIAAGIGTGLSAAAGTAAAVGTALTSTTGALGLAASAVGTGVSIHGQSKAASASREQERIRQAAMRAEQDRLRRQTVRAAMQARAQANTAGMFQGGSEGSGVMGGLSQVVSDGGQKVGDINTSQYFGEQMFQANAAFSQGRTIASIGQGASALGADITKAAPAIGRLGQQLFSPVDPWNTQVIRA